MKERPIEQPKSHENKANNWQVRNELFVTFFQGVYGEAFTDEDCRKLLLSKIGGKPLSDQEKEQQIQKVFSSGLTVEKAQEKIDSSLNRFDDSERLVVELSIGTSYCGNLLDKDTIAKQTNLSAQKLDEIATRAIRKLKIPNNKTPH